MKIALFGTMKTSWREGVKQRLVEDGHTPLDNTDPRWKDARTAEDISPLLRIDHRLLSKADLILWHHDSDTAGNTARIELGHLPFMRCAAIVHVEPDVVSREYIRALCLLFPQKLFWVETLEEAFALIPRLDRSLPRRRKKPSSNR